jgi:hypothetical protein
MTTNSPTAEDRLAKLDMQVPEPSPPFGVPDPGRKGSTTTRPTRLYR